jgi:hypothetical protein
VGLGQKKPERNMSIIYRDFSKKPYTLMKTLERCLEKDHDFRTKALIHHEYVMPV